MLYKDEEISRGVRCAIDYYQEADYESAKEVLTDICYNLGFDIEGYSAELPEIAEQMKESLEVIETAIEEIEDYLYGDYQADDKVIALLSPLME